MTKEYIEYLETQISLANKRAVDGSDQNHYSYQIGIADGLGIARTNYIKTLQAADDPTPGPWENLANGTTRSGTRVLINYRPNPKANVYGEYEVWVNGVQHRVTNIMRARDGGSDRVSLYSGDEVFVPRSIGGSDRTPEFNGEKVL